MLGYNQILMETRSEADYDRGDRRLLNDKKRSGLHNKNTKRNHKLGDNNAKNGYPEAYDPDGKRDAMKTASDYYKREWDAKIDKKNAQNKLRDNKSIRLDNYKHNTDGGDRPMKGRNEAADILGLNFNE